VCFCSSSYEAWWNSGEWHSGMADGKHVPQFSLYYTRCTPSANTATYKQWKFTEIVLISLRAFLNKCYANVGRRSFPDHMIHKENYQLIKNKNSNQKARETGLMAVQINMSYRFNSWFKYYILVYIYGRMPASFPTLHPAFTNPNFSCTTNNHKWEWALQNELVRYTGL